MCFALWGETDTRTDVIMHHDGGINFCLARCSSMSFMFIVFVSLRLDEVFSMSFLVASTSILLSCLCASRSSRHFSGQQALIKDEQRQQVTSGIEFVVRDAFCYDPPCRYVFGRPFLPTPQTSL